MTPDRRVALKLLAASGLATLSGRPALAQSSPTNPAFANRVRPDNSLIFSGNVLSVLADTKDTGGYFALMQGILAQGLEAPPHIHQREDETFVILEGEVEFSVGGTLTQTRPGDIMFLPRGVLHSLKLKTPTARMLALFTPGGLEAAYRRLGTPTMSLELPPPPPPLTAQERERRARIFAEYGFILMPPR